MRSGISDCRLGPFEDLAINPLFARAVAGSTVVRRNECADPRVATSLVWNPGSSTVRGITPAGKTALVLTRTGGVAALATYYVAARLPINPGETLAVSLEGIVGPGMRLSSDVQFFRADGSTAQTSTRQNIASPSWGGGSLTNTTVVEDGVPTRFGRLHTAPADAVRYALRVFTDNGLDGVCYATDVLVEKRPAILPFFFAGMQDDTGIAYENEGSGVSQTTVAKAAVVEVRKQLLSIPRGNSLVGWQTDGGATLTPVPGGVQVDIAAGTTQNNGRVWRTATPPSPTSPCSVAAVITVPAGYPPVTVYLQRRLNYVGPPAGNDQINSPNTVVQPGTSVRLVAESSATRSDTSAFTFLIGNIGQQSQALRYILSEPQLEAAPVAGPYFDGGITPDADLTPMWSGEENASSSVLYGVAPSGLGSTLTVLPVRSWRLGGLRLMPMGSAGSTSAHTRPALSAPFVAGQAYTVLALLTIESVPTFWNSYSLNVRTAGGNQLGIATAPAAPGTYLLRLTFTATGPSDYVRLDNREGAGRVSTFWGALAVIPGVYDGPFPDPARLNWRGPVNASAQVFYPRLVA